MKTSTLFPLFIGLIIIAAAGCSKPPAVKPGNVVNTVTKNPKTAVTVANYDFNDTLLTNNGWTKTFDDEFTGGLSNWFAYTGSEAAELEYFEPANVQIVDGVLQITAKKETITDATTQKTFNYTSGSIVSNQTFSANATTPKVRMVARVKMASGYGLASVFEAYGANWPTNGQINFFAVAGDDLKGYLTQYFYGTTPNQDLVTNAILYNPVDQDLSQAWHVFVTEWTQNSLNYYLDGQLVETKTTGGYIPALYTKPENISLLLPIGGLYYNNLVPANVQTGIMYVDYVKVFTSN